jgi:hypothetical protein
VSRVAQQFWFAIALAGTTAPAGFAQSAGGAQSQSGREVFVGSRVRVFAPDLRGDRYVGRIDSLDVQAIVLDTAGARIRLGLDMGPVLVDQYRKVTIRLAAIREIEVSGGRTARGPTIRGMLVGALTGGLLWGLGNLPEINPGFRDFASGFPPGAIVGAVVGGGLGFALGGERWFPAAIPR